MAIIVVGQLYQVSYLGATYYAVPVYYPGSTIFQSWYLLAYINGVLYPYVIVPGNSVTILYNPYLGGAPSPGTPPGGTPPGGTPPGGTPPGGTPPGGTPPGGTPPGGTPPSTAGVLSLNGATGALNLVGANGVTVALSGTTLTITGSGTGSPSPGSPTPSGGTTASSVEVQPTAPTSPATGQYWYNNGTTTQSGVPAGSFAYWSGSSWVVSGTTPPPNTTGVIALNGLDGLVSLVAGSGITLTPSGQQITIAATGGGSPTPGSPSPTPSGVSSVNSITGAVQLVAGSGVTLTPSGQNLTIASSGIAQSAADLRYPLRTDTDPYPQYLTATEAGNTFLDSGEVVEPVLVTSNDQNPNLFLATPNGSIGAMSARAIQLADLPPLPGVTANRQGFIAYLQTVSIPGNTYTNLNNFVETYDPLGVFVPSTGTFNPAVEGVYAISINGYSSLTQVVGAAGGTQVIMMVNGAPIDAAIDSFSPGRAFTKFSGVIFYQFEVGDVVTFQYVCNYNSQVARLMVAAARVLDPVP